MKYYYLSMNSPVHPQTLLPLHAPRITQHHVQALPAPQPHDMLHVQPRSVPTDRQVTGQILDGTGLYYYNARYYAVISSSKRGT